MPAQTKRITIFGKEGMQGTTLSFPLVLESYQSPLLPPSRIGSASDDEPMRKLLLLLAPDR